MTEMKRRAFAYARISREDKNKPKWSIATQLQRIRERCERESWVLAGEFEDRDVSGTTVFAERPGWAALEEQIEEGDLVVVADTDRMSRDGIMGKLKMRELYTEKKVGVIVLEKSGIDISTADGTFMLDIDLAISERERGKLVERLRFVHEHIHKEGSALGCRPPLGYDYDQGSKEFRVNEEEAEIVRRIFTLKIAGYGYQAIALKLKAEGVPTKRGGTWRTNTIKRIILNPFYAGLRTYLGETRPLKVPTIVDTDTRDAAIATVATQNHAPRRSYPLSGLLRCPHCGGPLTRVQVRAPRNNGTQGEIVAADWRCGKMMQDHDCKGTSIREGLAEKAVVGRFFEALDEDSYQKALERRKQEIKLNESRVNKLKQQLGELERKQMRLMDEFAQDDSTLSREAFNKKNELLEEEISDLETTIHGLEGQSALARRPLEIGNIKRDWELLDPTAQREALRLYIDHVVVSPPNGVCGAGRLQVVLKA